MARIPGGPSSLDVPGVELVEQIGRGGFATVYRGCQPAFNRAVAVKLLDEDPGGSSSARFRKEVRALGSLSGHPHVVAVYEAGTVGGRPYLVMPFLSGGSLEDRLRGRPLTPQAAVEIIAEIADAVAAAHRLGILHRDIKPANILFTAYGEPQLADFGIARLADATLTGGPVAATVTYAAPEVLRGAPASEAADIYSLGATLYAALRGAPPFAPRPEEAPITFALRVFGEPVPSLRSAGIPAALTAVVVKAMAKDPADRHPSAEAFGDALRRANWRPPTFFTPPPPPPPLRPVPRSGPRRPRRRTAAVAAALAVLVAGGAAVAAERASGGAPSSKVARPASPTTAAGRPRSSRTSTAPPTTASSTVAPPRPAPQAAAPTSSAPPSTVRAPLATLTGSQPPPADGITSASALPASTLTTAINAYYALVQQHRLSEAWNWLTPAFQQRLGRDYYYRFWESISHVQLLSVVPQTGAAALKLRYTETNGTMSTEWAEIIFGVDLSTNRILINGYRVNG